MICNDVLETIGRTPVVRLNKLAPRRSNIYVKIEGKNPGGSIKDRAAIFMLNDAETQGKLKKKGTIVEPTSGNTGIGLALVAAVRGYHAIIVMPDNMSKERISLIRAYGAEVVLTPGKDGMVGSIKKAEEIAKKKKAFIPQQFDNPSNPMSHYIWTAKEILEDLPDVDYIFAGIGTGGTASGIGRALNNYSSKAKVIGVEPEASPVITKGVAGTHKIQGIGANFIPGNYDKDAISEVVTVTDEDAIETTVRLAKEEGILAGISSGAAVYAAIRFAKKNRDKKILAILPDVGERYLSTGIFDGE